MRYGVGIDLGTSFTSAAINGANGTHMVPMSPTMTVPSVAYPAPNGALLTGDAALNALSDPTLAARNFKRRLGDPTPLVLGGSSYPPAALMAAQLRDVLVTVTRMWSGPPESIVLTYPAIWGPYRREHFTEVAKLAGVNDFRLVTEPEAAATYYSGERRLGDGDVVAVYDLGGGTFDTTLLRMRSGQTEILGTPEGIEHLGGVDFDEAMLTHIDRRLEGAISGLDPADPAVAARLTEIRAMCVRAKENLSSEPEVRLTVPLPFGPRQVTVTRPELNEMIRPSVQMTIDALHRTMASAGLRGDDISAVLLAGGSSRVPLITELLAQEFNKPVRLALHPKFTVALGAAMISARPRPATPPPPASTASQRTNPIRRAGLTRSMVASKPARGRKWLVPAIAAAAVLLVAVVVTLFIAIDRGTPTATGTPSPLQVFDGKPDNGFSDFVGFGSNTTPIAGGAANLQPYITATPDPGKNGVRVVWTQDEAADASQPYFYLQTAPDPNRTIDLSANARNGGALLFDVVAYAPPPADSTTQIRMDCVYPCTGALPATRLLSGLPVGQVVPVKIALSCFGSRGLNLAKVNTPLALMSNRRMDLTFSNVRVQTNAVNNSDPVLCSEFQG